MSKLKTRFVCQSCGAAHARWSGRCDSCNEWNTLVEEIVDDRKLKSHHAVPTSTHAVPISTIDAAKDERVKTGIAEFDRVLGGGIVAGAVILLGGDPGIGKSTLMMQLCSQSRASSELNGKSILYVTGEESLRQIRLRADRLGVVSENFFVYPETNLDLILETIRRLNPHLVIVDSVQTLYRPEVDSAPGSITQVRESTAQLLQHAKQENVSIFLIGHVTKDGVIAGPRILEHMVDTVLQFEGDQHHAYRIVRSVKNRFGSTNEIGIFEMREDGLHEVVNPSEVFLSQRTSGVSGSCITTVLEGTRALLLEVQALVTPSNYGMPQRAANGFDRNRLQLLLAVLEKRNALRFGQFDVFVNVAGGVTIGEPAADLAVAMAIVSSIRDQAIDPSVAVCGEIGLGGEVRTVRHLEKRIAEAQKLGFAKVIVPRGCTTEKMRGSSRIIEVGQLGGAIGALFS